MGELRGGYIPGNLPPDEQAHAVQELYDHIMGGQQPDKAASETKQTTTEPDTSQEEDREA